MVLSGLTKVKEEEIEDREVCKSISWTELDLFVCVN